MSLDQELRAVLTEQAERYEAAPPDFDAMMAGGLALRRRHRIVVAVSTFVILALAAGGLAVGRGLWDVRADGPVDRPSHVDDQELPQPSGLPGLFTFPPVGAAPSTPEHGELVANWYSHWYAQLGVPPGWSDGQVYLYADGRLIWSGGGHNYGWVEQRLTPEGVDLVRTEIISTGLFDPGQPPAHSYTNNSLASIQVYNEGQLVEIMRSENGDQPWFGEFDRLHDRLWNPQSWLPDNAWEDRELKTYVPSRYAITSPQITVSRALALLPASVQELLADARPCRRPPPEWDPFCFDVTTEEARAVAKALFDAGTEKVPGQPVGPANLPSIYFIGVDPNTGNKVPIVLHPILPHAEIGSLAADLLDAG